MLNEIMNAKCTVKLTFSGYKIMTFQLVFALNMGKEIPVIG